MKTLTLSLPCLIASTGLCLAGALNAPTPVINGVQPGAASISQWGGFYAGGSIGLERLSSFDSFSTDPKSKLLNPTEWLNATSFGGFAGYNFQSVKFVYGGEIAVSSGGVKGTLLGADYTQFDTMFDLKARAGYSFGAALAYGFVGASFSNLRFENGGNIPGAGLNYGIGIEYMLNNNLFIGAEFLTRSLSGTLDTFPTFSAHSTTQSAQLRVGWKF